MIVSPIAVTVEDPVFGTVQWTPPPDLVAKLQRLPPEARELYLQSFSTGIRTCARHYYRAHLAAWEPDPQRANPQPA